MAAQDPAAPDLLAVEGLTVSFATDRGRVTAIRDVSFAVKPGEILSIVGESGSGKTVSMLSVLGLTDRRTTTVEGAVTFRGRDVLGLPDRALRRIRGKEIALISQDPMTALTPVHTVGWQIVEQIRTHESVSAAAAKRRAIELLDAVGLPNPAEAFGRYPHQLSGGMRQRAVIAMALSCSPALLVADEPTTALDVTVQAQVLDLIVRLRRDFGSAIVLITHDMGVVSEVADRVIVMYAGRIVESGTRDEIFGNPSHPYTWGLIASIPPIDGARPRRLASIPGLPPTPANQPPGCGFAPRCRFRFAPCDATVPPLARSGHAVRCHIEPAARPDARRLVLPDWETAR
ncbi:ABC transporter ATP-binding protein [Oharaeibacter diazotrophicus]|uniref:Peptide/nickel transport system ATP-binding protein n=1 Tax=Oharaeibacter diazotrophicus TaxID=1920512 RepID=A0A4R6RK58_9HYPH|nr:ABC transporter ATP-binding protein [Oharaeibacter diazotrophicus]TDP86307.1 peptide/nickel transport system ATP-binding protein [Oharaeibacter diazotrophicus]BBE71750.1 oligopeptide transport ATP-binding protein OppD [Pleomorphomonas sp. SM30]GLS78516.1 ABC transporter ATP-binding protein [Oharaeibacter diazotrophicus]